MTDSKMKSTQDGKDTAKERQSMMDALTKMLEMADNLSDASCYESIKQNAIFTTKMMQYKMDAKGLDVTSRDVPNQGLSLTGSSLDPPSLALTTTSSMDSLSTMSNVFRNIAAESPPDIKAIAEEIFNQKDVDMDGYLDRNQFIEAFRLLIQTDERFKFISRPRRYIEGFLTVENSSSPRDKFDLDTFHKVSVPGALGVTTHSVARWESTRANQSVHDGDGKNENRENARYEPQTIGDDKLLFHPNRCFNLIWGGMISVFVLTYFVTVPLSFGWMQMGNGLFIFNTVIDFIFILDVVKTFFTGSVDEDGNIVMDGKRIKQEYLMGSFIFDFMGSFPYDFAFFVSKRVETGTAMNSIKLLKLLLIVKLLRFRRIKNIFDLFGKFSSCMEETMNIRISDAFTKLTKLFFMAIIIAHWSGCFQFMLARAHDFPEDSWVVYAELVDKSPFIQWSWSLYKALLQMLMIGFQSPAIINTTCDPITHWCGIEHWVTLACLSIIATFFCSFLISFMLDIVHMIFFGCRLFEEKYLALDGLMRSMKVPTELRQRTLRSFRMRHPNNKFYDETVLQVLSSDELASIRQFQAEQLLRRTPIFEAMQKGGVVAKEMSKYAERVEMTKNDIIFDEHTYGDTVCFIESGLVELCLPSTETRNYRKIGKHSFFGEVSPLLGMVRTATAQVRRDCVLYQIDSEDFLKVLEQYPEEKKVFLEAALDRLQRVQTHRYPNNNTPTNGDEDQWDKLARGEKKESC